MTQLAGGGTIRGLSPELMTGRSSYSAPFVVLDEVDKMCDLTMFTVARSWTTDADGGRARNTAREEGTGMSWNDTRER